MPPELFWNGAQLQLAGSSCMRSPFTLCGLRARGAEHVSPHKAGLLPVPSTILQHTPPTTLNPEAVATDVHLQGV